MLPLAHYTLCKKKKKIHSSTRCISLAVRGMESLAREGDMWVASRKITGFVLDFLLATFLKVSIVGIARNVQILLCFESVLVGCTRLFWYLHLLEKPQHAQWSRPLPSEKHPAPPHQNCTKSPFLLLFLSRSASTPGRKHQERCTAL